MDLTTAVIVGVVASLLAAEALAWTPRLIKFLIHVASSFLPEDLRERYHEEWSAEAKHRPGQMSRLVYSIGLLPASLMMRRSFSQQHRAPPPPHQPPAAAERLLRWVLPLKLQESVLGDLAEHYQTALLQSGSREARRLYWWHALRSAAALWLRFRG